MHDSTIKNTVEDVTDVDENTWEILDRHLVKEAEKAELARFKKMCVHSHRLVGGFEQMRCEMKDRNGELREMSDLVAVSYVAIRQ